ncbi:hypothetical protein DUI87_03701 [Hirundo rustica rustica]|uniref:Uncharacterized protein n=1 Tax=Hirundo rustica rustica TaxID=333673 RepID=A0A3M0LJ46_HIRRU|nr:hypothetical protein DUI87_03701 [Hirundo rustica rustica]
MRSAPRGPEAVQKHSPTICHGLIQTALEKGEAPEHLQCIDGITVWGNTAGEVFEKEEITEVLLKASFAIKQTGLPFRFFLPLLATVATQEASFHNQKLFQSEFCNTWLQAQRHRAAVLSAATRAHQQCLDEAERRTSGASQPAALLSAAKRKAKVPHESYTLAKSQLPEFASCICQWSCCLPPKWMDDGRVDVVYLDFSKALDTIYHNNVTRKLRKCRLHEWTVRWTENWMNGRSQRVVFAITESGCESVTRDVPQGSIMGPVLFNLFSSDLDKGQMLPQHVIDSTKMAAVANTPEGCVALQKGLDRVER